MTRALHTTLIGAGLSLALCGPAAGQAGPPAASSLDDVTGCTLEGDSVFVSTGRDATARRYKYAWDAAIDALCNGRGFALGAPAAKLAAAAQTTARPAVASPAPGAAPAGTPGAPREFPADAQSVAASDLARKLAGKVFNVQLHDGMRWRLDYRANGYLFVNASNGGATSGPWRAEEGRLCTQMKGAAGSCNEVREQGQRLYLKRDNGDVIALDPQ